MKVLSVGLIYCDIPLSPVPLDIFERDNSVIEPVVLHTGGDALNVAVVLSKLGISVSLCGRIGMDMNGQFIKEELRKAGVDIQGIIVDSSHQTAVSYVLIEPGGERHFLSECSINSTLRSKDIPDKLIQESDVVYFGSALAVTGMPDKEMADLFGRAHQYGKITALDVSVSGMWEAEKKKELVAETLKETDIFIPSYEEASYLAEKTDIREIVRVFSDFPIKLFGIKLGSDGCILTDFKEEVRLSVYPNLSVIDTTGAGDCFAGGILCGYLHGWSLRKIGCFASAVSAYGIQSQGASTGVPDFDTILEYAEKYGDLI